MVPDVKFNDEPEAETEADDDNEDDEDDEEFVLPEVVVIEVEFDESAAVADMLPDDEFEDEADGDADDELD